MVIDSTVVQALFTIIIALATIVYVIKTNDIAKANRQQVIITERLNEISQKQIMNIDRPIMSLEFEGGSVDSLGAMVSYSLQNIGTGPALDVRVFYGIARKADTYHYDPRTLEVTIESDKGILPLARDRSIHISDSLPSSFSRKLLYIANQPENGVRAIHLYVYCFYENIFRARYKSVYPLSIVIGKKSDGVMPLVLEQYLKPIIRPLNRYEAELEELAERFEKGESP
jgi:hypothetical protein